MELLPVKSTNIQGAAYDPETRTMHVQFKSGLYAYPDVPAEKFAAFAETFQADESSTKYLNAHFRTQHPPKKVEPVK
jgi:hypothetical protein